MLHVNHSVIFSSAHGRKAFNVTLGIDNILVEYVN